MLYIVESTILVCLNKAMQHHFVCRPFKGHSPTRRSNKAADETKARNGGYRPVVHCNTFDSSLGMISSSNTLQSRTHHVKPAVLCYFFKDVRHTSCFSALCHISSNVAFSVHLSYAVLYVKPDHTSTH